MTDTEAARLLADMRARYLLQPYDATLDVTIADICAALGVSDTAAHRYAKSEVAAGRLTCRLTIVNNHPCNVYRRK